MNSPGSPARLDRPLLLLSGVVVLGTIVSILDTTIVNVALATLGRDLHASLSSVQWVATGYLLSLSMVILGMAVAMPVAGRLTGTGPVPGHRMIPHRRRRSP